MDDIFIPIEKLNAALKHSEDIVEFMKNEIEYNEKEL